MPFTSNTTSLNMSNKLKTPSYRIVSAKGDGFFNLFKITQDLGNITPTTPLHSE
jgi:hypothetical protein